MLDSTAEGICTAPMKAGGSCSATIPCTTFFACSGLTRSDPTDTGTCAARDALFSGGLGATCSLGGEDALCELGLVCALRGESGQVLGTCENPVASGAACPVALPDACPKGEYCRITTAPGSMPALGQCLANPALGEECRYSSSLPAPCGVDQFCSSSTNLCAQSKNLGETCTTDEECSSDTCGTDAKCAALLECERG